MTDVRHNPQHHAPQDAPPGPAGDPGQAWMAAFQRGDEAAFTALVAHYGARVVSFFRRAGADASAAEDLAQEAFLRVARARDRYEPTAKFTTWLHRILFRIALNDAARNRWRRSVGFAAPRELEEGPTPGAPEPLADATQAPLPALTRDEVRRQVRAAVAELPEPQRTALLLHRFEECSQEEVATTLGLSVPAVKSLLFRARENVRKRLAALLGDEVDHGM
ncbi:MAG: sigma-70 family RNA polymerase sigma factor [Planctomycetes bacterium]|nr:sigma-70 family RNA polymerase sigma factor [Planctomycetota bacterium]